MKDAWDYLFWFSVDALCFLFWLREHRLRIQLVRSVRQKLVIRQLEITNGILSVALQSEKQALKAMETRN